MPEVDEFENSNEKVSKFEESLLIPNEKDSNDSVFYSIYFAVHLQYKSGKIDICDNKEIEEIIG